MFLSRTDEPGSGVRLAVKDLIDVAGLVTSLGCAAVAHRVTPVAADASCIVTARAGGARIVGKTNLHELAYGSTGVNHFLGTPRNPLDPSRIPGGSSSGSAVAVAVGAADAAFGTDTGGSIRIPAACCGVAGLKTTWGRIPMSGIAPLAPSLDTVGPIARDVAGLVIGMKLLEPGFEPSRTPTSALRVGRYRGLCADPLIDRAIDSALHATALEVEDVAIGEWRAVTRAANIVIAVEAWYAYRHLAEQYADELGEDVLRKLTFGSKIARSRYDEALRLQTSWRRQLATHLERMDVIALPTMPVLPPLVGTSDRGLVAGTLAINLAGFPAVALPVPAGGRIPASLQLVGPPNGEELLLAVARSIEDAVEEGRRTVVRAV